MENKKISFTFPQIVFEQREVELSQEEIDKLEMMSINERADWIWSKMTEQEQNWTSGINWLRGAVDVGYCGIDFKSLQ